MGRPARLIGLASLALVASCSEGEDPGGADAPAGRPITGRVIDAAGEPVMGAEVILILHAFTDWSVFEELDPAYTDAEGRFSFPPGSGYAEAEVSADGLVAWFEATFLVEEDTPPEDLVLVLAPPATLSGQVIGFDGDGQPCWLQLEPSPPTEALGLSPQALELLEPAEKLVERDTAEDGSFAIELPRGDWSMTVMVEGVPAETRSVRPGGDPVEVRLGRAGQVHGVVRGADGRPLPGAMVSVTRPDRDDWRWETIQTNDRGQFLFGAYPYSSVPHLLVTAEGHAVWAEKLDSSGTASSRVDVQLEPEQTIRGRLLDSSGAPVPDCLVTVHGARRLALDHDPYHLPTTWEWHAGVAWARSDEQGHFAFERLYPGSFEVLAHPDGPPEAGGILRVDSGSEGVVLRLGRGLDLRPRLRGTLRRGDFDLPIPAADLVLRQHFEGGSHTEWRAEVDRETGRFDLIGLDPAPSTLSASAVGHATAHWDFEVDGFPRVPLALKLHRLQDLPLRVRDAGGAVVRYPRVSGHDASGARYDARAIPSPGDDAVSLAHGLPAMRCTVRVWHPDDASEPPAHAVELEVDLRTPPARPLEIELPWTSGEGAGAEGAED